MTRQPLDDLTKTHLQTIENKLALLSEAVRAGVDVAYFSDGLARLMSDIAWELNQMHGLDNEKKVERDVATV